MVLMACGRALGMVLALLGATGLPGGAQPAPATTPATTSPATTTPATTTPASNQSAPAQASPNQQGSPNQKEQQLLERIRLLKAPRWRSYGVCRYDWSAWRLTDGGVRTTDVECGADNSRAVVAVHCDTLQVSRREGEGAWSVWRLPLAAAESKTTGGEDLMVAALCAHIKPSAVPTASPAPLQTGPSTAKPAAKPSTVKPATAKPAAKPAAAKPAASKSSSR